MKKEIYLNYRKEISEFTAFNIVKEYFINIKNGFFKDNQALLGVLERIRNLILKNGLKSKKKRKQTSIEILKDLAIEYDELKKLAILY